MERKYWFWINNLKGIGNNKIRKLLCDFGDDPYNIFRCGNLAGMGLNYLSNQDIDTLTDADLRKKTFLLYEKYLEKGIKFVFPFEEQYPKRLNELFDKPYILYYKGRLPIKDRPSIAVVGSRNCSEYGRSMAREIARALALHDVNVISGLALGVDSEAHRGSIMAGGRTFGVLAGTVEECYPAQNFNLYMDMLKDGGVLSEFGPGTRTVPGMFPMRNRIISGLCDGVIVVEAGKRSGSLITVSRALEQNRDIYAVPGRVGDPDSMGCNRLIAEGASIIISIDELMESLGLDNGNAAAEGKNNLCLASEENLLYSLLLDFGPKSLETLIHDSKLPVSEVLQGIVGLEIAGLVREVSKNIYVRVI